MMMPMLRDGERFGLSDAGYPPASILREGDRYFAVRLGADLRTEERREITPADAEAWMADQDDPTPSSAPLVQATAWSIQVAIRDDVYSYLDVDGNFSPDGMAGETNRPVRWFPTAEEAQAVADALPPGVSPVVVSNARY